MIRCGGWGAWALLAGVGCSLDYGVKGRDEGPKGPSPENRDVDTGTVETDAPTVDSSVEDTGAQDGTDEATTPDEPVDSGPDEPVDSGTPDEPVEDPPLVACAAGAYGAPVGCAMDVGPGRLFLWGDEHVTFEEYRPSSERFWGSALTWLADSGRLSVEDLTGSSVVPDVAGRLGLAMGGPGAGDIVIVDLWRGTTGADISAWLAEGRAVMVMAIGFGASECTYLTAVTSGLPLQYDCAAEPWGPVGTFADHPIATGLAAADAPFVNGRAVVADEPATAGAVAFIP